MLVFTLGTFEQGGGGGIVALHSLPVRLSIRHSHPRIFPKPSVFMFSRMDPMALWTSGRNSLPLYIPHFILFIFDTVICLNKGMNRNDRGVSIFHHVGYSNKLKFINVHWLMIETWILHRSTTHNHSKMNADIHLTMAMHSIDDSVSVFIW